MQNLAKKSLSMFLAAIMLLSCLSGIAPTHVHAAASFSQVGGWLESIYAEISGVSESSVTAVSYSGTTSGSLTGQDLEYLVRTENGNVRIDIPGVPAGTYTLSVTAGGETYTQSGIKVLAHDRSGYAHYNYTRGVGAYNDDGSLKDNTIVLYVTDSNKNTVSVTSKDGTTVTGIGNILGSTGMDVGTGLNSKGGKANTNQDILRKLAADGTPLVVRFIGNVTAPEGLTAYDSADYGGTVGDNGYMARMSGGKDITLEGIGAQATINGWGFHFICQTADYPLGYGSSFEARNLVFRNVPEDCLGMEGQQEGSTLTAPVERCWVHNCSFYAPTIANPAESDKAGGDGACDFKRGNYMTMDYCYYEGYHKTNLIGSSDSSLQYHITWHHNYYKNCEARGPLVRNSNIHIYNTVYDSQSSYAMNPRANAYIFSEYNSFINCKNPVDVVSGAVKSYNDTFTSCIGEMKQTVVTSKTQTVSTNCKYANFDTNSSVSYIPSGNYKLDTDYDTMLRNIKAYAGAMPTTVVYADDIETSGIPSDRMPTAAVVLPYNKSLNNSVFTTTKGTFDNMVVNVAKTASDSVTVGGNANGYDIVFRVDATVNISMTEVSGTYSPVLCAANGKALITGTGSVTNVPAGVYYICSSGWDPGSAKYKEAKVSALSIEAVIVHGDNDHTYTGVITEATCTEGGYTTFTCACGASYVGDYTSAKGHTPGAAATCTTAQTCTVCGDVVTPATGHSYEGGYCTVCHAIDPATCSHTDCDSVVTAPTCTEDGYTTHTCKACGYSFKDATVAATGHTPGAAATCTTAQTCTVCGAVITPALGHSYVGGTCSVCGAEDPAANTYIHNFTTDGTTSDFYSISGNLSTGKGSVTYDGLTLTQCLKIESSTSISFTAPAAGTLTLVFGGTTSAAGKGIEVDGTSQTIGTDNILTVSMEAGAHSVAKDDSVNLFYMVYAPTGSSGGSSGGDTHTHSYTSAITTPATCTAAGVRTYTCSCGDSYTEAIPVTSHTYVGGTCSVCGATEPSSSASTYIHNFTTDGKNSTFYTITGNLATGKGTVTYDGQNLTQCLKLETATSITFTAPSAGTLTLVFVETAPTIKIDGTKSTGTSNVMTFDLAAGAHTITKANTANLFYMVFATEGTAHTCEFVAGTVVAPTCTEQGYTIYTCSCGKTENRDFVDATGHSYTAVVTAPTCTAQGYTTHTCSVCGDSYVDTYVAMLDHTYVDGKCSVCGAEDPATHTCNFVKGETVAPTCTADGYTIYTCSCGKTEKRDIVTATGHTTTLQGQKDATCTEKGYTGDTVCSTCGQTITTGTEIAALGHNFVNGVCTRCGKAEAAVGSITEAAGHLESAYVEWNKVDGATGYNVYVKATSASSWTQIDTMLIREYPNSLMRADALGLKAGTYTMKIVPIVGGSAQEAQAMETETLNVLAHDRSGYAFVAGASLKGGQTVSTSSGAYNDDGTLKSNAVVIYVTEDTKNTVSADIPGAGTYTGISNILAGSVLKVATAPICVRLIGNVTDLGTGAGFDKGDMLIDNNGNSTGLTIEGVGEDATVNGWGIRLKNSSNVEIRNLGIMNVDSSEGDDIGIQQTCDHIWVHNCDFFYGMAGSDADQAKGDGALDTKKSEYVTHSYNHFWDTGKSNLQGGTSSDTSNYITYHHNWYDHADSRCPRVRRATVHVYNNYYDGVSKYGIGATLDSDIFAEANYFRNTRFPILISGQGNDITGGGIFSGEAGGMIKAYGNVIEYNGVAKLDREAYTNVNLNDAGVDAFLGSNETATNFDAVVVENRNDTVSSSYSAVSGGATYNNFDTASGFYSYNVDTAENAKANCISYAGRMNGGDFQWTFTDADDTDYGVNTELKAALGAYKSTIVAIGGNSVSGGESGGEPGGDTPVDPAPAGGYVHNFTENGKTSTFYTITGNLATGKGTVTYNGLTLTQCLKLETATSITFTAPSAGTLTLVFVETAPTIKIDGTKSTGTSNVMTFDLAAGAHTVTKADTANLFYMVFTPEESGETHTHSYTAVVTKEATCTETGVKTYTCSCGDTYTETLPTIAHTEVTVPGKEATCTETGLTDGSKCSVCNTVIKAQDVIPTIAHTEVTVPGKAATCTETGLTDGKKCSVCDAVIKAQDVIPTIAHTEVTVPGKAATCTETGLTDGKKCSVCGEVITAQTVIPAKGHTAVTVPGKAATCTETGLTDGSKCSVCGEILTAQSAIPATGHSYTSEVTTKATCTADGVRTYTCSKCNDTYTEAIPSTGHSYQDVVTDPTCTERGYTTHTCANCGDSYVDTYVNATGHSYTSEVTTEATCTADGVRTYTCSKCNDTYTEAIPSTGHSYQDVVTDPTCTERGYTTHTCTVCGYSYVDTYVAAKGHTEVSVSGKAATCTETGLTDGKKCSVCGETTVEQTVIPAKGHTEVTVPGKEATCTEDGLTEGKRCSVCGEITVAQEVIDAKGHTEQTLPAVAPTCTETGLTEGKKCSVCGETTVEQTVIPATGHTEVTVPGYAATCTEDGLTDGKKCSVCGETLVQQTVIQATGHQYENGECVNCGKQEPVEHEHFYTSAVTTEPTCTTTGVKTFTCSCNDSYTEVIPATGHTEQTLPAVVPTCTETGLTEGKKCSVCGEILTAQSVIPATGHSYTSEVTTEPTCTAAGVITFTCSNCGDSYTKGIDALGHTGVTVPAVAPTCTATGLTEGSKCSVCGEILTAQSVIPATGHSYTSEVTTEATCTADGVRTYTCSACNDTYTEVIPATGHSYTAVVTAPTCTAQGYTTHTCTACGASYKDTYVNATGHSYTSEITTQPTCTQTGIRTYTCSSCGHSYEEIVSATGHSYESVVTAPTCTAQGYTTHTCSVCGTSYKDTYVNATGHTEVTVPGKAPTASEPGLTDGVKCSVCGEILVAQEVIPATGLTISGTVTSFGEEDHEVTIQLYLGDADEPAYTVTVTGKSADYSIAGVAPGTYTLKVTKKMHTPREYTVVVEAANVTKDLAIWLYGDVNGDGLVNAVDATQINRWFSGKASVFDSGDSEQKAYRMTVANVFMTDGTVNATDATQIKRYFGGKSSVIDILMQI